MWCPFQTAADLTSKAPFHTYPSTWFCLGSLGFRMCKSLPCAFLNCGKAQAKAHKNESNCFQDVDKWELGVKHSKPVRNHSLEFKSQKQHQSILEGFTCGIAPNSSSSITYIPRGMDKISCYTPGWALEEACLTSMHTNLKWRTKCLVQYPSGAFLWQNTHELCPNMSKIHVNIWVKCRVSHSLGITDLFPA
jgi:hypothetical protein